jgi:hypothetical protein
MVMVLAIWWFYDQLSSLLMTPEIQLFFHNLQAGDPCFLGKLSCLPGHTFDGLTRH